MYPYVVNRTDVGMPDLGSGAGLALEALQPLGSVLGQRVEAGHLERYRTVQMRVMGLIHCPHTSGPDATQDVVTTDLFGQWPS
jgi:hypothetical protein